MGFFEWAAELHKTNPYGAGAIVPLFMAAVGLAFALVAEVILKPTGINLGKYKKEYEEDDETPNKES